MTGTGTYPSVANPGLQGKIALKKEFAYKYEGKIEEIASKTKSICMAGSSFELAPHQEFVKRFMSYDTPYNSLLLYHGLGSGKTCSASTMTETLRTYSKYMANFKKIMVVASPNVQENFKLQLFNPTKLEKKKGLWVLNGCVGNSLLNDLNAYQIHSLPREELVSIIKKIIRDNYSFIGYVSFANFIEKCRQSRDYKKLKHTFESRVIVIDEIHNIRITDQPSDSIGKRVAGMLLELVKNVKGMKFIFMTGTPMYNDAREIVFLLNLFRLNDNRSILRVSDVFTKEGELKPDGEKRLLESANGYISYVRGENPYSFPYLITPKMYADQHSSFLLTNPTVQFNEKEISVPLKYIDLYGISLSGQQEAAYQSVLGKLNDSVEDFDLLDSLGYNELLKPIQTLIISYPVDQGYLTGEDGLSHVMQYKTTKTDFEYKETPLRGMFEYDKLGEYSAKMKSVLDHIIESEGIVLVYSQYITGGLIPFALALEEYGFKRYGEKKMSLFKDKKPDVNVFNLGKNPDYKGPNKTAKYAIISGDKLLSPNVNEEISVLTQNNVHGERVKVVLISQAGTEGIDLKNLRQVHILEPWYNLNRIEQIIGRARRNCSHKELPLEDRNVQLFLHCAYLSDPKVESLDHLIYRMAEKKSIKIGKVTRLLKRASVDCILHQEQQNFSNIDQKVPITLSNGLTMDYVPKDEPFSNFCDYMENCNYACINELKSGDVEDTSTFSYAHTKQSKVSDKVKQLYQVRHVYTLNEIIHRLHSNTVTKLNIIRTIQDMIEQETIVSDKFNKTGTLVMVGKLILFQPEELQDPHLPMYQREHPIPVKPLSFTLDTTDVKVQEGHPMVDIMRTNYNKATLPPSEAVEMDWYSMYYEATQYINKQFKEIGQAELDRYLVTHLCEQSNLKEELDLLNYLFSKTDHSEFEQKLLQYYKPLVLTHEDMSYIHLLDRDGIHSKGVLYVLRPELVGVEKEVWTRATHTEKTAVEAYPPEPVIVSNLIGFMGFFNDKHYHFKTKQKQVRITTGKYVLNNKKTDILTLLNDQILHRLNFYTIENSKSLNVFILSIVAEVYLRYLDETRSPRSFLSKMEYYQHIEAPSIKKK
jgi:hypothetical protein